jgi:hypothetical protein
MDARDVVVEVIKVLLSNVHEVERVPLAAFASEMLVSSRDLERYEERQYRRVLGLVVADGRFGTVDESVISWIVEEQSVVT